MDTRYTLLMKNIIDHYQDALMNMYYWDRRAEAENNDVACRIRNDYVKVASAYYVILTDDGMTEASIESIHEIAKALSKDL